MAVRNLGAVLALTGCLMSASPASAYLFWSQPKFAGEPVKGDEPGLAQAMPKATPKELQAHMLWNMRAGLNVAALQCQFSPMLMTVSNYNDLLAKNGAELTAAYTTLSAYFKRTTPKTWQKTLDQYTTRTYNGFSTMHAQLGFCETASSIGRAARKLGRGQLTMLAAERMREFRNSLVPVGDAGFPRRQFYIPIPTPSLSDGCWTKKDELKLECAFANTYRTESATGRKTDA